MFYQEYGLRGSARSFMYKVYGWMAAALALTAGTAYYIFQSPVLFTKIFQNPGLIIVLLIGQIGLVVALSAMITRLTFGTALAMFLVYAILTGITLSSIFFTYDIYSIYTVFAVTAGMFGCMALYGYFTQADLTAVGSIAMMGLFGLILCMLVNMFLQNQSFDYILSLIGVGIFTLLTAYDVQKIKQLGIMLQNQGESTSKIALLGSLTLYLDFINLFLMLLRLMGRRKD